MKLKMQVNERIGDNNEAQQIISYNTNVVFSYLH